MRVPDLIVIVGLLLFLITWAIAQTDSRRFTKIHPHDMLGPHADFGSAVAIAGNFVAVGAQNDRDQNGTVFIYSVDSTTNTSALVSVLRAPDAAVSTGSKFGCALVGTNDTTLIVGAQCADGNVGVVFVYDVDQRSGKVTTAQEIEHPMRDGSSPFFGGSISAAGDFLLIGASSGNGTGSVFLYHAELQGDDRKRRWILKRSLNGDAFPPGANFGINVAVTEKGWIGIGVNNADNTTGVLLLYPPLASNSTSDSPVWVVLPGLAPGAFFGTSIVLVDDDENSVLWFASAPFQANGTVVAGIGYQWGNFSVVSVIVPPSPSSSIAVSPSGATFGASMAYDSATRQLFVGAWSFGGGAVFVYNTTLGLMNLPVLAAGDTIMPYPTDLISFGSAIAAHRGSLVVGAFADFNDEGSAFFFA